MSPAWGRRAASSLSRRRGQPRSLRLAGSNRVGEDTRFYRLAVLTGRSVVSALPDLNGGRRLSAALPVTASGSPSDVGFAESNP